MALFDTTFAPYVPFGSRTLTVGATGTDVAVLQAVYNLMLTTMNPPTGPMGAPVSVSGTFDAATRAAVMSIQSYFGLAPTGNAGLGVYFIYGQGIGANTTYGGPEYGSRQLTRGMSGGDVTVLQNRLNCFRYASLIGAPASGRFDAATAAAVLALKADAEANGDTGFPDNAIAGFGFYDATWLYTFAGGRNIMSGRNGFDVVFLQVILGSLGYYTGAVTGFYDAATITAVQAFQAATGVPVSVVVGPATFYQIGLHNPMAAPRPLAIAWPPAAPPPPPPPPTGCSNGVDNNADLSGVATCLKSEGYTFVLRYLGGPCYTGVKLTKSEAAALTGAGLLVGTIYVGANAVAAFRCGTQTLAQGRSDGAAAAALATAVGQPAGAAIYLDLQGDQVSPQAAWLAYVQGWTGAVAAAGFRPGVYSSPEQLTVIDRQPWAGAVLLYWVARYITVGPIVPPPCPTTELAFATLWQYADGTTICGVPGMDLDSLQNMAGLWS